MANGPTTEKIEVERIARTPDEIKETRRDLAISSRTGVLMPVDLAQALEFAQNMAKAEQAVPKHLRGSPGACLAILEYAGSWEMAPYGVANKSYVVNDRLCFESQLIHAVIKKRADLKYPKLGLETEYLGEGPTRQVRIFADCYIDDERTVTRVLEITTPMFKDIQPKNSPLWVSNPDQQLFYRGAMLWQRRHKPEILLGIYTRDEMQDLPEEERAELAKDVSPPGAPRLSGLAARLGPRKDPEDEGFHPDNEERTRGPIIDQGELENIATDTPDEQDRVVDVTNVIPARTADTEASAGDAEPGPEGQKTAPVPAATVTPAAAATKTEPAEPKTDEEYQAYLQDWLAKTTDDARIHDRYGEEKDLRKRCGADITACQKLKKDRLTELGSA